MLKDIKIGTLVKVTCTIDGYEESGTIKKIFPKDNYTIYGYSFVDEDGRKGSTSFTTKDIEAGITIVEIIG